MLKLHSARAQDLGRYLDLVAAEGEVFVQFWLKPGDPPLELAIEEPGEVEGVPEVLRGCL